MACALKHTPTRCFAWEIFKTETGGPIEPLRRICMYHLTSWSHIGSLRRLRDAVVSNVEHAVAFNVVSDREIEIEKLIEL